MTGNLAELPFRLSVLHPPYEDLGAVPMARAHPVQLAAGAVIAMHVRCPSADWTLLPEWIPAVRAAYPAAPLVLCVPQSSVLEMIHLARRAGTLRARAVLMEGEPIHETLRRAMTQPEDLASDVVEWLTLRRIRMSPVVSHLVRQIFTHAPQYGEVTDLLRAIGEPETSVRFRFRKKSLPSPRRWLQAARAMQIAMRIQAEPKTSLLEIAFALGYSDHSALSQAMVRTFGLRPNKLRNTLGWEWLLDRWLASERTEVAATA